MWGRSRPSWERGCGAGPESFAFPMAILSGRSQEVPGEIGRWEKLGLGPFPCPSSHPLLISIHNL